MDTVEFLKQKVNLIQDLEIRGAVLDLIDLYEGNSKKPFDKLKELWNNGNRMYMFEHWVYCQYMNFRYETYNEEESLKQVHKWLAEHCGFLTTAEVRRAIQELKNQ